MTDRCTHAHTHTHTQTNQAAFIFRLKNAEFLITLEQLRLIQFLVIYGGLQTNLDLILNFGFSRFLQNLTEPNLNMNYLYLSHRHIKQGEYPSLLGRIMVT